MSAIYVIGCEPLVERSTAGSVHVSFDEGETWVRFKTEANYRAVREHLDREEAAHDQDAIASFAEERDVYFARLADLRAERDDLRAS